MQAPFIIITKTFLAIWGIKRKKTRVVEKELIEKQSLFPHDLYYIIYANIFIHVLMCMLTLHDDDQMFYMQSVIIIPCSPKTFSFKLTWCKGSCARKLDTLYRTMESESPSPFPSRTSQSHAITPILLKLINNFLQSTNWLNKI